MAEGPASGLLDTCTYIDLGLLDPDVLPLVPEISAVTTAELHQGVAMATDETERAARTEKLSAAVADFEPLRGTGRSWPRSSRRGGVRGRGGWT